MQELPGASFGYQSSHQSNKLFRMLYVNRKIYSSAFHTFINRCAIVVHILIKFHCETQWGYPATDQAKVSRVIDHVLGAAEPRG